MFIIMETKLTVPNHGETYWFSGAVEGARLEGQKVSRRTRECPLLKSDRT
jgi:hypothetical protein